MNDEHLEMDIKTIIVKNCREMQPLDLKTKTKKELLFSPTRYSFNESQFDIMTLQLIDYINQNKGDGRKNKTN